MGKRPINTKPLRFPPIDDDEEGVPEIQVNFDSDGNLYIYQEGEEVLISDENVNGFIGFCIERSGYLVPPQ